MRKLFAPRWQLLSQPLLWIYHFRQGRTALYSWLLNSILLGLLILALNWLTVF